MTPRRTIAREHAVIVTAIARCLPPPRRDLFVHHVKRNVSTPRDLNIVIENAIDHACMEAA